MTHNSEQTALRLAAVRRHLSASLSGEDAGVSRQLTKADASRPKPGGGAGTLQVTDSRTGKKYELPISEHGTIKATDLKKITAGGDGVGLRYYDPGYTNTTAVISKISFIDGAKGILRYRGYPIEQLAEKANFSEVSYLIMYGELPTSPELSRWEEAVMRHSDIPAAVKDAIDALPHDAHFMGIILTALNALSTCHPEQNPALAGQDVYKSKEIQDKQIVRLIENFLYMLDAGATPGYRPNPRLTRAIDIMFTLHAEHEMNCSTAAARHLASSGVDVYTAIGGAVGALYGPLHGGANEAVLRMLERIGSVENIPKFIEGVKNKKEKMSGFGHRVYKNFDPRAKIVRTVAEEVFSIQGRDPLIDVAVELEKVARADDYFVKRNLHANVDFYSGLSYRAMGFPLQFFTVLFAIPRVTGYLAHWRESLSDPDTKIIRPQEDYQGVWLRDYEPINKRGKDARGETLGSVPPSNAYRRRIAGQGWQ